MSRARNIHDIFKKIDMCGGDTTQCWLWTGAVNKKDGRPYYRDASGKSTLAYRIVYELVTGELIGDRYALHQCDNKICCNPRHIRLGTHQENMAEMEQRDRHGLPKTVVRAIRALLDKGRTQEAIAELYGVSREAISAIATKRVHKDD